MVFAFAFLGFLTGCEQSVVSEPEPISISAKPSANTRSENPQASISTPPSPNTEAQIEKTPTPKQTPYDNWGPDYPANYPEALKSSERCQSNGEKPISRKARIQRTGSFIQSQFNTVNEFTGNPRFCRGALQNKLFIIDHDQLLAFDPVSNKQDILFDFSTRWNQEKHAPILGLQSCLVNTQGDFYITYRIPPPEAPAGVSRSVDYASGVYKINLQTKTLTPIRYQPHPIAQMQYTPPLSPLPTNFAYESGYNLALALSPQNDVFMSTGMSLRKVNAQNEAVSLLHAYGAGAWSEGSIGEFPAKLENNDLIGSDGERANIQSVDHLGFDDKNNLFIHSEMSRALFRMNIQNNLIYMNNIKGLQNYRVDNLLYTSIYISELQYMPKYQVFLGRLGSKPSIVTRDGCSQIIIPQEYPVPLERSLFYDVATLPEDNSIYAIENESKEIIQVILDPDIAEKEQWEPPQAWKDYTGLD